MSIMANIAARISRTFKSDNRQSHYLTDGFRLFSGIRRIPPKRGTRQALEAYSSMPWLRATTNKIARNVGQTNWKLYAVQNSEGKAVLDRRFVSRSFESRQKLAKKLHVDDNLKEINDHPLIDLLQHGNEYLSGTLNIQVVQLHLEIAGEAFILKERDSLGIVVALWPIPPHWMKDIPTHSNPFFRLQHEELYAEPPASEIVWIKDPDPTKPYERGSGGALALADELDTDEFAAKHTKSFFYNSARPDVIVSGENLSPDDTKRLEQSWLNKNQGFLKSFKPFFVSKAIQIKELSQTFQSMQLIDLRKFERDTIHQFFGIPPEILGITDTSNRATIDAADFIFNKNVIAPRVEVIRVALQTGLINDFDERLILDYENPVQEDLTRKLEVYKAAPHVFTANQWRELAGDQPNESGDVVFLPFNLEVVPVDTITVVEPLALPDETITESTKKKPIEKAAHDIFETLSVQDQNLINVVVGSADVASMNTRLEPIVNETVDAFGQSQSDLLGTLWVPDDPAVNLYIQTRMATEITGVTIATQDAVRRTLAIGMDIGENVRDLEKRITKVFRERRRNHARTIARTESVAAGNNGTLQGMTQAGSEKKMWISSRDGLVRDTHAVGSGMDGQIVGINEKFVSPSGSVGDHPAAMDTAAESVNCRCAIITPNIRRDGMSEVQKTLYWKTFESDRKPFERQILNASRDAFTEQEQDARQALRSNS